MPKSTCLLRSDPESPVLTEIRYPDEVVINDGDAADGASTPAGEPDDDFFSSWDKPAIKKPTPPVSRTATPPVVGRTPSPFLKAGENGKDIARTASPLSRTDSAETAKPASRVTHSALKKSTPGAKKNVLGAKKVGNKLGVKKVVAADIDFDEAEKKAKEEAERIKELGYNPEEEEAEAKKAATESSSIVSPTPVSPPRGGYGAASHTREKSASEIERLGMGMGRLGFGQIGAKKPAAAQAKSAGGFGSVGPIKAASNDGTFQNPLGSPQILSLVSDSIIEGEDFARKKFGAQKSISSDEFFGKGSYDPSSQAEAKTRLQGFEGATSISSNAYFGRPDEEVPAGDYGDLETAAKDFVRKFGITAGDDLENLTQLMGEGASKLQGAIRSYLGS